jgi:hypothetical protein
MCAAYTRDCETTQGVVEQDRKVSLKKTLDVHLYRAELQFRLNRNWSSG